MEENTKSLTKQQAWESAPKMHISCFLYAIFYTFCLYQNRSGITFPFYVGGTLFFFGFYLKKYGVIAARDNRFWMAALILLGVINCTTDSYVLIGLNRLLGIVLFAVWMLQMILGQKTKNWYVGTWCREILRMFWGSLCKISAPFKEASAYRKKHQIQPEDEQTRKKRNRIVFAVIIGIAVSIPILFVVGVLLLCADAVFYQMFCDMFNWLWQWQIPEWLINGTVFRIIFMVVVCFVYTYGMIVFCRKRQAQDEAVQENHPQWDAYIAITAAVLIAVLYVMFCGVQIFGLFLGKLSLPEGYTYAQYARSGFFPLLFVCIINICLVPFCHAFFARSKVLNVILTVICGCTYIMIASSAYRMLLYINCYGMTFLRLSVLWTLAVMVLLTAGMIYDVYHEQFGLFRYLLVVVTLGYLGFAMIHPDYWIAKYNLAMLKQGETTDVYYLQERLSADAAPAIAALKQTDPEEEGYDAEKLKRKYFERIQEENTKMNIRNFNFSRAVAGYYADRTLQTKKALVD